jgi:TonB family protein
MVTIPHIEWQGWLVSVILHGVIVTTVVVGLDRDLLIETTEPFRLDLIVVEKDQSAREAAETVVEGGGSQQPLHRERSDRSFPKEIGHRREVSRPHPQARDTAESVRPIRRQILESNVMNREVTQQPDASTSERRDIIRVERDHAVIQELRSEQPEAVVSDVAAAVVSHVIAQQVTKLEATSRSIETKLRSVQDVADSIPASDANPDGSEGEKHVAQTVPGTVESPSHATGAADPIHAPEVHLNGFESGRHVVQTVPANSEGPSHATGVSPSKQMGQSTMPTEEKQGSAINTVSAVPAGKGTGPDYGWLKRLLWERINRIKQYSDEALDHEWEGRVVMVVTVRSDGRIDEVGVAESSGNRSLDREAVDLLAHASPLELDRALGAASVKLRVPISFGLE